MWHRVRRRLGFDLADTTEAVQPRSSRGATGLQPTLGGCFYGLNFLLSWPPVPAVWVDLALRLVGGQCSRSGDDALSGSGLQGFQIAGASGQRSFNLGCPFIEWNLLLTDPMSLFLGTLFVIRFLFFGRNVYAILRCTWRHCRRTWLRWRSRSASWAFAGKSARMLGNGSCHPNDLRTAERQPFVALTSWAMQVELRGCKHSACLRQCTPIVLLIFLEVARLLV